MANVKLKVDIKDLENWTNDLKANVNRLEVFTARASNLLHQDIIKHFDSDRRSGDGSPWKPTSGSRGSTLVRTGTLRGSFWKRNTKTTAEVKTSLEYAAIHNYGGSIKGTFAVKGYVNPNFFGSGRSVNIKPHQRTMNTVMPKREFMWMSENIQNQIQKMFNEEFWPD